VRPGYRGVLAGSDISALLDQPTHLHVQLGNFLKENAQLSRYAYLHALKHENFKDATRMLVIQGADKDADISLQKQKSLYSLAKLSDRVATMDQATEITNSLNANQSHRNKMGDEDVSADIEHRLSLIRIQESLTVPSTMESDINEKSDSSIDILSNNCDMNHPLAPEDLVHACLSAAKHASVASEAQECKVLQAVEVLEIVSSMQMCSRSKFDELLKTVWKEVIRVEDHRWAPILENYLSGNITDHNIEEFISETLLYRVIKSYIAAIANGHLSGRAMVSVELVRDLADEGADQCDALQPKAQQLLTKGLRYAMAI